MRQNTTVSIFIGILLLSAVALYIDFTSDFLGRNTSPRLGLDLQGGPQTVLEAQPPEGQSEVTSTQLDDVRRVVENRVNGLGVSEPLVQTQGKNRILVELPGSKLDADQALKTLQQTGFLEFISSGTKSLATDTVVSTTTTLDASTQAPISTTGTTVYPVVITGVDLDVSGIGVSFDQLNKPEVNFKLKPEAAKKFGDFTGAHVNQYMPIVLDKRVISSPVIQSAITGGNGRITVTNLEEAKSLAVVLKYGSLPVQLKVVSTKNVGATLGTDSVDRSIRAGLIGLLIVALFMIVYYRLPGVLAVIALLIYTAISYAIFKLVPVTLTLAGIAGFILSIGMAVDANVLIFARMKDELRKGKTIGAAVNDGFRNAWPSIRDSNISTMITCAILYWFGSNFGASIIRGFALTLAIGVAVSMFSAITITRTFLTIMLNTSLGQNKAMYGDVQTIGTGLPSSEVAKA